MTSSRPRSLLNKIMSFRNSVTRLAWPVIRYASSKNCTKYISTASCRASNADIWTLQLSKIIMKASIFIKLYSRKSIIGWFNFEWLRYVYFNYLLMSLLGDTMCINSLTRRANGALGMINFVAFLNNLISRSILFFLRLVLLPPTNTFVY